MAISQAYMTAADKAGTWALGPDGFAITKRTLSGDEYPMTLANGHPAGNVGVTKESRLPSQPSPALNTTISG